MPQRCHSLLFLDERRASMVCQTTMPCASDWRSCNSVKQDQVLLDPCASAFAEHLRVSDDGSILGLSVEGGRLVNLLGLDEPGPRTIRQRCLRILVLYDSHPDDPEVRALYLDYFGYPDDLPNLQLLRPETNSRPTGLLDAFFRQRAERRLSETYF